MNARKAAPDARRDVIVGARVPKCCGGFTVGDRARIGSNASGRRKFLQVQPRSKPARILTRKRKHNARKRPTRWGFRRTALRRKAMIR